MQETQPDLNHQVQPNLNHQARPDLNHQVQPDSVFLLDSCEQTILIMSRSLIMAFLSTSGRKFTTCPCCDKKMEKVNQCSNCTNEYCGIYGCWKCRKHRCDHCDKGLNGRPCGWCQNCTGAEEAEWWKTTQERMERNTRKALGLEQKKSASPNRSDPKGAGSKSGDKGG